MMQSSLVFGPGGSGIPSFSGSVFVGIGIIAAWVVLASSRFIQGGVVERPERVPQLYGYTVCLVTLIWAIVSTVAIVESALTLNAPLYRTGRDFGPYFPSVSSFESFRTTYDMSRQMMGREPRAQLDTIPEPELRRRYEALRAERLENNTVAARRSLITSALSLLIAAALFAFHWRWLRRLGTTALL
jgi:ABC-type branched-subunit amino acid transport system permease subunit